MERLCRLCTLLEDLQKHGDTEVSSNQLSKLTGTPPHTIRKDISYAGDPAETETAAPRRKGYEISRLLDTLKAVLGLTKERRVCVVGLGKLGSALLNYPGFLGRGYRMQAGFDSSVNRLEILDTQVPLYSSSEITEVCRREEIDLGVITVPPQAAQTTAERLIEGGIRGIVNFAPAIIQKGESEVFIRNVFVAGEFHILSAMINQIEDHQT